MNHRIGFIGSGTMAKALCKGFISSGRVDPNKIMLSGTNEDRLNLCLEELPGVTVTVDNSKVVESSDIIIIAVKPHLVLQILGSLKQCIGQEHLLVSVAAGVSICSMSEVLEPGCRIVRVMPNTPAIVSCSASVCSTGPYVTKADEETVKELFSTVGSCHFLPESSLNAVTGLSGSGPAYAFVAIEALADGGVRMGLPRSVAQQLAAQTLLGAAKMVLDENKHPAALKDAVCSPGGTTIAGLKSLEEGGFRASLINAVESAAKRAEQLGK